MKQENNFSGLQCLQILFSQYRRNVNFSALITVELQQKYLENQGEVLLALSNEQQLRAELLTDAEVLKTYAGPVLVRLKNDAWVLMANSRQFVSSETVTIIDPAVGSKQKTIAVPKSQLEERMSGAMIIFRNLAQVDAARHSRLFCLAAIAAGMSDEKFCRPHKKKVMLCGDLGNTVLQSLYSPFTFSATWNIC